MRRATPEATAVLAMSLAAVDLLGRSLVNDQFSFLILSAVALLGMGIGNVVGAPLVKKNFADNPAPMLTLFALLMQAGATIPVMASMPLAEAGGGWRFSIGSWALLSAAAAVPWIIQWRRAVGERKSGSGNTAGGSESKSFGLGALVRNPIALGTALFYAMASLITYAMLAWMPTMLQGFGHSLESASGAFSIFTFMTLPLAAVMPWLAQRMKRTFVLVLVVTALPVLGFVGLLTAPDALWLWAALIGMIGGAFPLAIAHFNLRTTSTAGAGALSGFAMGVGYFFGTVGPLLGGWLSSALSSWTVPVVVYAVIAVPVLIGGILMSRPGRYLEDLHPDTSVRS